MRCQSPWMGISTSIPIFGGWKGCEKSNQIHERIAPPLSLIGLRQSIFSSWSKWQRCALPYISNLKFYHLANQDYGKKWIRHILSCFSGECQHTKPFRREKLIRTHAPSLLETNNSSVANFVWSFEKLIQPSQQREVNSQSGDKRLFGCWCSWFPCATTIFYEDCWWPTTVFIIMLCAIW